MKRPFAYLGFSCLLGLLVAFFSNIYILFISTAVLIIVLIIFSVLKIKYAELKLSIIGLAFACISLLLFANNSLYNSYDNQTYNATIKIKEMISETDYSKKYDCEVLSLDNVDVQPFRILLYSTSSSKYEYGDTLVGDVTLTKINIDQGFSYNNSLLSDGYKMTGNLSGDIHLSGISEKNIIDNIFYFKNYIRSIIPENYSENTSQLLSAMLLGDKDSIDDELYDDFSNCGVNHILVVSGMHLSILCCIFFIIIKQYYMPIYIIYSFLIPLIIIYVVLTGAGLSIMRSAIMLGIFIIADILGRETDSMNNVGFAVILILFFNPFASVDIGFILSISSTSGIIILSPKMTNMMCSKFTKKFNKIAYKIITAISISISAFIFSAPILLYLFHTINPLSIICSSILAIPSSFFLSFGLISLIVYHIPYISVVFSILKLIVEIIGNFIVHICKLFSPIGKNLIAFTDDQAMLIFIGILLISSIYILFKPSFFVKISALVSVILIITTGYLNYYFDCNLIKLYVIGSAYGDFVAVSKREDAVIIDSYGGNYSTVKYCFEDNMIKNIDKVFLKNYTKNKLMENLSENYEINNIYNYTNYKHKVKIFENVYLTQNLNGKYLQIDIQDKRIIIDKLPISSIVNKCDIGIISNNKSGVEADVYFSRLDVDDIYKSGKYFSTNQSSYIVTFNDEIEIKGL